MISDEILKNMVMLLSSRDAGFSSHANMHLTKNFNPNFESISQIMNQINNFEQDDCKELQFIEAMKPLINPKTKADLIFVTDFLKIIKIIEKIKK
ncbi:MAG: hypothetical protein LBP36_04100 [Oscillospiraceae bacterium]|nr:hypothetical protein [Oscillospiraceae bacterium]